MKLSARQKDQTSSRLIEHSKSIMLSSSAGDMGDQPGAYYISPSKVKISIKNDNLDANQEKEDKTTEVV